MNANGHGGQFYGIIAPPEVIALIDDEFEVRQYIANFMEEAPGFSDCVNVAIPGRRAIVPMLKSEPVTITLNLMRVCNSEGSGIKITCSDDDLEQLRRCRVEVVRAGGLLH